MMKNLFLPLALLLMWGCRHESKSAVESLDEGMMVEAEYMESAALSAEPERIGEIAVPQPMKVIKTGNMGLQVEQLDAAKRRVDSLVVAYGGYYAQEEYGEGYRQLDIRVPQERFDRFVVAVEAGRGDVRYKNISAKDVTEEYIDVQTRLESKRVTLERYRDILRRATTIKEIMEVEQYVRELEEEIQSAEGRLRYIDNQSAFSTLELTLSDASRADASVRQSFWTRAREALDSGWRFLISFAVGLLYLWPLWVIVGVVLWWSLRLLRRRKRRA